MQAKVTLALEGVSPLLMHAFPMVPIEAFEKKTPEEQAELVAYRTTEDRLYVPAIALQRAFVNGATYSKGKGRASLQKPVAACVLVGPEHLVLSPQEYTIDARPVVIPSTKGRVMRYRPRFDRWRISAEVEYDPTLLTVDQLRRVVDDTGSRVGLMDFRPEKKGPFGRFSVVEWKAS